MRTKKTVVVLISGKAGAGKTTLADILVKKLQDIPSMTIFKFGFANALKFVAKAYGGWDEKKDERGRAFLQNIGKVFREYDENIWVKHVLNQMDKQAGTFPFNFVVIDDWRFPNELNYLSKNPMLDVVTIRVFGRQAEMSESNWADVSENSLPEVGIFADAEGMYEFEVDNSGSIDELNTKADAIISDLEKQYIVQ